MGSFSYVGLGVLLHKGNRAVERAVAAEAQAMAETAQEASAVDTGTLSGGIEAEVNGKTATITTTSETRPGQAFYQHEGSIHNPATHYMEQAALASTLTFPERIAAEARAEF